ncbi:MAG TPA: hypothetical protein VGI14_08555 [Casimicrobiaceae bacterium]|jgi:hypothetical protein
MPNVATYIALTDDSVQFGDAFANITKTFSLPANAVLNPRPILSFLLTNIEGDDDPLNVFVTINGAPVHHYTYTEDIPGNHTVQEVVDQPLKIGPGPSMVNTLVINNGSGPFGHAKVSDVVLWFQVNSSMMAAIQLEESSGNIKAGGAGADGDLILGDHAGNPRIRLDADTAGLYVGGNQQDGDVVLYPSFKNNDSPLAEATIRLDGETGTITVGGGGGAGIKDPNVVYVDGRIVMLGGKSGEAGPATRIKLDAAGAAILAGGNGQGGDLYLFRAGTVPIPAAETIHLEGETGHIYLAGQVSPIGTDCAEDFEVEDIGLAEPGTVMVIGEDSRLSISTQAYDRRVAGVIAGAGDSRPGIILGRAKGTSTARVPVALVGRVFCKVDADDVPIEIGDLLTTSSNAGYAMKADDSTRAFGAVVGKALASVKSGRSVIPVLVGLL